MLFFGRVQTHDWVHVLSLATTASPSKRAECFRTEQVHVWLQDASCLMRNQNQRLVRMNMTHVVYLKTNTDKHFSHLMLCLMCMNPQLVTGQMKVRDFEVECEGLHATLCTCAPLFLYQ